MRGLLVMALAAAHVSALSLILQSMDSYCFAVDSKRGTEIKVTYMVSGLNEDQVEFKVCSLPSHALSGHYRLVRGVSLRHLEPEGARGRD